MRKIPIPSISPQPRAHRASEYAAGTATTRVMTTTARPTQSVFVRYVWKWVSKSRFLRWSSVGGSLKRKGLFNGLKRSWSVLNVAITIQ